MTKMRTNNGNKMKTNKDRVSIYNLLLSLGPMTCPLITTPAVLRRKPRRA
jgi:hypothetical protein